MTMPPGVTLCTVTYGKALGALGAVARITGKVTMDRRIVHAATGWSINPADEDIPNTGEELTFEVPHVDQPGFLDTAGQATTHWYYTLTGKIIFTGGGKSVSYTKTFQPLVGQTNIDLDLVLDGPVQPGVSAPSAEVLSVAGRTGHVSGSDMVLALEPDLSASYVATVTPEGHGTVDGVDDTAALQAAVTAASSLGAEVLIGKGREYVIGTVTLPAGAKVRVDGTLTKKAGTQGAILSGLNADNIRVVGEGTIDGNKANQTAYTAGVGLLDFDNCDNLLVEGIALTGHYLPTAATSADTTASVYVRNSSNAHARSLTVRNYAREAIWLENCTDSSISHSRTYGGVDSWSGVQFSGTRNLMLDVQSYDAGASGISFDSTYSTMLGCLVRNNTYFHGYNFGHVGAEASYVQVIGCVYELDAGVNLTATASQANGFNVGNASSEVTLANCTSVGAKGHGFNVSSDAVKAKVTGLRASGSGLYGLNAFGGAAGVQVLGSDLDLSGNTSGPYLFAGTNPVYHLVNVRTSSSAVQTVLSNTNALLGNAETGNLTARGNLLVTATNGTDYRENAVARTSGANVFKMAMVGVGTATALLITRDGVEYARLTADYNAGVPRLASTVPVRLPSYTTAGRPSAASVGAGSQVYDSTLGYAITSNGTSWVNGTGTVV